MKTLDKGKDKIRQICDALRSETLEPAKVEASTIIEDAQAKRDRILRDAEAEAAALIAEARKSIEQERHVFEGSLAQAAKQSMESLKQTIESRLFNEQLFSLVEGVTNSPAVVASFIDAIVSALGKEGLDADLVAIVPKSIDSKKVSKLLAEGVLKTLKDKAIEVGSFAGGAQVKLRDKKMTIDLSDEAIRELLTGFLREDFRKLFFVG